jgi:hypothetical protein
MTPRDGEYARFLIMDEGDIIRLKHQITIYFQSVYETKTGSSRVLCLEQGKFKTHPESKTSNQTPPIVRASKIPTKKIGVNDLMYKTLCRKSASENL